MRLPSGFTAEVAAQYELWIKRTRPHSDQLLLLYLGLSMAGLIFTQCEWRTANIPLNVTTPQGQLASSHQDVWRGGAQGEGSSKIQAGRAIIHQESQEGETQEQESEGLEVKDLEVQDSGTTDQDLDGASDDQSSLAPPPIPNLGAPKIRPALERIEAPTPERLERDQTRLKSTPDNQPKRRGERDGDLPRDQFRRGEPLEILSISFSAGRRSRTRDPRVFKRNASKATMSIKVRNKQKPQRLHIRWLRLDQSQQIDHLYVKYSSRYTLTAPLELDRYHERRGAWRVEIRSASGALIGEARFKIQ